MINFSRIKVLIIKDLLEIKNDKMTIFSLSTLPIIFSVILPIILLLGGTRNVFIDGLSGLSEFVKNINMGTSSIHTKNGSEAMYAILMYFFIPLFLLIPVMIATVISSSSFVGEKENKTIEGLLYTPLTNRELILGKMLAAGVPSMLVTWVSIIVYGIIIDTFGLKVFGRMVFPNINWIMVIFILDPLIVFFSISLVILVSQHVKTTKSAQSASMILILPILGGVISQASGALLLGPIVILIVSLGIIIIDVIAFLVIAKFFNRDKYILNI